jgi:hypothetical protein
MRCVSICRCAGFLLVLVLSLSPLGVSIASAQEPNVGLLRVVAVQHPRQVAPSIRFLLVIDVEYAIRFNATIKSVLFQGSVGNLGPELWSSDELVLRGGGDRLWKVNLTAPSTEGDWALTAFAYYLEAGKWQYYADDYRGTGFAEMTIRVASLATLEIDLGTPNVTVKADNSSEKTSNIGSIALQLPVGLVHEVSVPPFLSFENSTRLAFSGWKDGVNNTERTLMLDGDSKLLGSYRTQYFLLVNSIVSDYSHSGWYDVGANVSLRVASSSPMSGLPGFLGLRYVFKDWSGDLESGSTSISVIIDKPKVINANFVADYTPLVIPIVLAVGIMGGIALAALRRKRSTKPAPMEAQVTGEVVGPKFCDNCGQAVAEDWTHCVHCGSALHSSEPIQG